MIIFHVGIKIVIGKVMVTSEKTTQTKSISISQKGLVI